MSFWEYQLVSMADNDHMDNDSLADLGVVYASETSDYSLIKNPNPYLFFAFAPSGWILLEGSSSDSLSSFSNEGSYSDSRLHELSQSISEVGYDDIGQACSASNSSGSDGMSFSWQMTKNRKV